MNCRYRRSAPMPSCRAGFTLIELLVVIAIIAILAAILFPVFARARSRARMVTCLSNVKQISLGVLSYTQDYDETFPLEFTTVVTPDATTFWWNGSTAPSAAAWQNQIQPYIKNWGTFVCPEGPLDHPDPLNYLDPLLNYGMPPRAEVAGIKNWGDTYYSPPIGTGTATIAWQGLGGTGAKENNGWTDSATAAPSMSLAEIKEPAQMTLITDASAPDWWGVYFGSGGALTDFFHYCVTWGGGGPYTDVPRNSMRFGPIAMHQQNATPSGSLTYCSNLRLTGGLFSVAFVDGHVKQMKLDQYFKTKTANVNGTQQPAYQYLWPAGF